MSEEKFVDIKINKPVVLKWKAKDIEIPRKKIILIGVLAFLIIVYFVFLKNYFGALVIFLCFVVFNLYYGKKPKESHFAIKNEGIQANNQLLKYGDLKIFWINYQAGRVKELKLISKKRFMPEISIPIGDADPVKIREIILKFLPEKEE